MTENPEFQLPDSGLACASLRRPGMTTFPEAPHWSVLRPTPLSFALPCGANYDAF
jgi:hypothetical protein